MVGTSVVYGIYQVIPYLAKGQYVVLPRSTDFTGAVTVYMCPAGKKAYFAPLSWVPAFPSSSNAVPTNQLLIDFNDGGGFRVLDSVARNQSVVLPKNINGVVLAAGQKLGAVSLNGDVGTSEAAVILITPLELPA